MENKIKKTIILCLCILLSTSYLGAQELLSDSLSLKSIQTIDSLHKVIGERRKQILSLACKGQIPSQFWGKMHDPEYSYCESIGLSVPFNEMRFHLLVSGTEAHGQVTIAAETSEDWDFFLYLVYSKFDGIASPLVLTMGDIQFIKDIAAYEKESDSSLRVAMRMSTMREIDKLVHYIGQLINTVIPVMDEVIVKSK